MKLVTKEVKSKSNYDKSLIDLGITPDGYTPKTELDKSGDFYMAPTLVSKIEKFSSIPPIEKVLKKISEGKSLTSSEKYLSRIMDDINSSISDAPKYEELKELFDYHNSEAKKLIRKIAESKFSLIISRKWFKDKTGGYDDNSTKVKIDNEELTITFEFRDQKVYL